MVDASDFTNPRRDQCANSTEAARLLNLPRLQLTRPMSNRILALLALCGLAFTTARAQDAVEKPAATKTEAVKTTAVARKPDAKPAAQAAPAPAATPEPVKKKGFFQRLFRGRERSTPRPVAKTTPTPAPKPTPTPAQRKIKRPVTATPSPTPNEPGGEEPKATPAPKKGRTKPVVAADKQGLPPAPPANADPEVLDKHKYDVARIKAMEDPEVQQLKVKSDTAATEEEAIKAQRAYSRALFDRMRKIEPSLKERIDRLEAGVMRRLDSQPPAPQ